MPGRGIALPALAKVRQWGFRCFFHTPENTICHVYFYQFVLLVILSLFAGFMEFS